MTFPSLPASLEAALAERGYEQATPVQAEVLQPKASGRDLVVSAQTGSGKTIAFGLAMAEQLLSEGDNLRFCEQPQALIIAPRNAEIALHVAGALVAMQRSDEARPMLERVIRDNPGSPFADSARALLGQLSG